MVLGIVLGVLALVIIIWLVASYNSFVRLKNQVDNAWAQIDVQLKRRADLIPNLVETVKGYAKHEKQLLENITKARAALMSAGSVADKAAADNMLSQTLKSLFAVSENYPDLKANQNFQQLQEELVGTENKVSYARQNYNDTVMLYNTKRESFPSNIIASMFGFEKKDLFETDKKEREPVRVSF